MISLQLSPVLRDVVAIYLLRQKDLHQHVQLYTGLLSSLQRGIWLPRSSNRKSHCKMNAIRQIQSLNKRELENAMCVVLLLETGIPPLKRTSP